MTFRRYEKTKDSGVEWLGEVPAHWEVERLKRITTRISSGKTPLGGSETYVDDGVLFLRSQNVYDTGLRLDEVVCIAEDVDDSMASSRVEPNDVLLNITGASIGRTCIVPVDFPRANVNQHVCVVRVAHAKQALFVSWLLKSGQIKRQIDFVQDGAAREGLNFGHIGNFAVPVPPPREIEVLCAFLDRETAKIDALVDEQKRLIELLKEKRQAVISHAVTKGLNPNAPMKDSGVEWLGEVPAHWEIGALKRFWTVTDCKHITAEYVEDGIPLASIREVQGWEVNLSEAKRTTDNFYEQLIEGDRKPQPGDIIFTRNATVGEAALVPNDPLVFAMGQDVCLLRRSRLSLSADFMLHQIKSTVIGIQLDNVMIGSTFKRVNVEEIRGFLVCMPPDKEQAQTAAWLNIEVSGFDELIGEARKGGLLLQERRTALISAAVTGKIDVRSGAQRHGEHPRVLS